MILRLLLLFSFFSYGAELTKDQFYEDFGQAFTMYYEGAYKQFTVKENLYALGIGAGLLSHSFDYDDHYNTVIPRQKPGGWLDVFNDLGVISAFPIIPGITYYLSIKNEDTKLKRFALELTATTYLSLTQSALVSLIDVHERPKQDDLSSFETSFRGDSSFVSGHIIPFAALSFKTYEFYGALYAAPIFAISLIQSYQRIHDQKHWMSDVVGGYLMVYLAGNGVKKSYEDNQSKSVSQFFILPRQDGFVANYSLNF